MKKNIFLLLASVCFSFTTFSQSVGITDFMRLNPYSNFNNPAYFVPYKGYVAFPMLGNMNVSVYNSSFIYKNLVTTRYGKPIGFTPDKFVNSLSKNNWLNTDMNLEILGFGFRIEQFFFTFNHKLNIEEQFGYTKKDMLWLLGGNLAQDSHGNYLYTSASPAIIEINPNLNIYQELDFGFQGQILENLYIGVRPKILFGIVNLKTNKFHAKVYTDPEDYTIYGNYDINIKMAAVVPLYQKETNGDITFKMPDNMVSIVKKIFSKNVGFALDLGAVYRINQELRVSASVTDLGFIKWKGSPLNLSVKPQNDGEYVEFSGFTVTIPQIRDFIKNGITFHFDSILNNNFSLTDIKSYSTMLTSKIMLDGCFDLTPSNRFIMQFKGYIIGKYFIPQFTIAYNGSFFNAIDVVVSYSMMKKSFANLGLGLGFRAGPVHLYAGADNLLAAINILNARKMNATFGLLIDFPFKAKIKEPELKSLFNNEKEAPINNE